MIATRVATLAVVGCALIAAPCATAAARGKAPVGARPTPARRGCAAQSRHRSVRRSVHAASTTAATPHPRVASVCAFGAVGDGEHDDAPAINSAILAVSHAGGGVVKIPAGTYLAAGSIHLLSHVTLRLEKHATVMGAPSGYEPPEASPYSAYQDPGHGDFKDAMFWGENLVDAGFEGHGTIDGGGYLDADEPVRGRADKAISVARCQGLTISGITIRRGGHFSILIDGCRHVRSRHLTIVTGDEREGGRDGWDVVSSEDVRIEYLHVNSFDDALVFKGDWALGATLPSGNVVVEHAQLSSTCCNALMFGSETCGDFSHYRFAHILITGAGKSGLGMVSMDGARISDVSYSYIAMSGVAGPIMEKVGIRRRCAGPTPVGAIAGVHYSHITASSLGTYSPTLWGQPGGDISDVTFDHVSMSFPAGHLALPLVAPEDDPYLYNPDAIGQRPAYAFYLHDVRDVSFRDSTFTERHDARPAFVLDNATDVHFVRVRAQSAPGTLFDVGLQGFSSVRVAHAAGAPLRVCEWCGLEGKQVALAALGEYD